MASPRTPSLLWRAFVLVGGGTVVAVAYSDAAWEKWEDVAGDAVPRDTFKAVATGSLGLHVAEAFGAYFAAKRGGLDKPGRWALSSLLWGFPVHRRLANERRALHGKGRAGRKAAKTARRSKAVAAL